jgi:transcriptional regulator with XRE-family HTH domain
MSVQKKIYLLREAKGLTQADVAKQLGMCVTEYGDIERGDADPKISKLKKVANFFGIRLNDLLDDSDKSFMSIHFAINRDKNQNNVYLGSSVSSELEKANLIIELKDKELAMKDREIENLREIIALLKREQHQ